MKILRRLMGQNRLLVMTAMVLAFMALREPSFFRPRNLANVIEYLSINGLMAVGMALLMIARAFDISIGSTMVLAGTVTVLALQHVPVPAAVLAGLSAGVIVGTINGVLVAYVKVNSFIATIGTMVVAQGVAYSLTDMRSIGTDSDAFHAIATVRPAGIPVVAFYFVAVACAVAGIARFTRLGNYAYAIGGNIESCRRMGIPVPRNLIVLFVISGLCASMAGVLLSSKTQAASATFGENVAMIVIAAIVLGGVHLSGGVGTIGGVVQGIVLIGIIDSATSFLGLDGYYQMLFRAMILLGVVVADVLSTRMTQRRLERTAIDNLHHSIMEPT